MLRHFPNFKDPTERVLPLERFHGLRFFDLLKMKLLHPPRVGLRNRDQIAVDPDLLALFREMA